MEARVLWSCLEHVRNVLFQGSAAGCCWPFDALTGCGYSVGISWVHEKFSKLLYKNTLHVNGLATADVNDSGASRRFGSCVATADGWVT